MLLEKCVLLVLFEEGVLKEEGDAPETLDGLRIPSAFIRFLGPMASKAVSFASF